MKSKTATVTVRWNVLANLAAMVLFAIMVVEGAGLHQNGVSLRPASEKILSVDGPVPPPPPQWPTPKTIV